MNKRKIINLFLSIITCFSFISISIHASYAATFSVSASSSQVSPGQKFTVTISVAGAGQFNVSASNGTVSDSSLWVDGSGTVNVTAGSSGTTSVTVTAVDVTGNDESTITGSKSASVSIKSAQTNNSSSNNSTQNSSSSSSTSSKPSGSSSQPSNSSSSSQKSTGSSTTKKSSVNTLSSLTLSKGTLSPKFSSSQTTYSVDLTSDTETVTVSAKATDSKAKVVGTGKKNITVGSKTYAVTVYAENGSKKVYSITFNVSETPTVYVMLANTNQKLGVLKDTSKANVPKGYKTTQLTIDDKKVNGWANAQGTIQLAYLSDDSGKKSLYLVENEKVVSLYQTIVLNGKTYIVVNAPESLDGTENLQTTSIKIADVDVNGWIFSDKTHGNYTIIYLMNEQGEKSLYLYESTEATLQKYVPFTTEASTNTPVENTDDAKTNKSQNSPLLYIFIATTIIFAIATIAVSIAYHKFKNESIDEIKDYYDRKYVDNNDDDDENDDYQGNVRRYRKQYYEKDDDDEEVEAESDDYWD